MKTKHTVGSANVFADLGIDEPEEYLQKANLAIRINEILVARGLTQVKAAELLGIDQPKVSLLKRGVLDAFSIERLMKFLRLLGEAHEIRPKRLPTMQGARIVLETAQISRTLNLPRLVAKTEPPFAVFSSPRLSELSLCSALQEPKSLELKTGSGAAGIFEGVGMLLAKTATVPKYIEE